ncbi:hypothetical protein B0H63DRAFT_428580 [Podospora didyma]|uniref:NmrA-like domain-containing protein n=1 Tax=Podospora didyma TaxID=330526 RepID=A0AAE0NYM1_9PEZI|nr:hypothetical protein B0H63DRAFT_428580 [Podospora didyma]
MVQIAIAGGSGQIAREVIDVLIATGKHEIIVLSRKDPVVEEFIEGTTWVKVDYADQTAVVKAIQGVHTLLSFIVAHLDVDCIAQKTLIHAAIEAGVKRFAPSEWGPSDISTFDWYAGKQVIRDYLKELNKDKKVLEYTLFQPGMLLDFLSAPFKSSKHIRPTELNFDFVNLRAIVVDPANEVITFTRAHDIGVAVAGAIDYEGEWPIIGGIHGETVTTAKLLSLVEKIKGKPWDVEVVKVEDLEAGELKTSWLPHFSQPYLTPEEALAFSKGLVIKILLGNIKAAWVVSDEWNQLLPHFKPTQLEEFLVEHWTGK